RTSGVPLVFWQQDIYSKGIHSVLAKRLGWIGGLIGRHYTALEARLARRCAAVVVISDDFRPTVEQEFRVAPDRVHTIQNWAPLDEIVPQPKMNDWSVSHGLLSREVVLYTGTLGLKHDPSCLVALAERLQERKCARVVVVSEGPYASWIAEQAN